ncbi:uncharacterized protein C2845_PM18G14050 [Panicum miliaceum]|uniref:Malectin-like domain-containing protein n=1 Tax=Panicum miliaceum TaxID=4540 RepID=A0A3L6PK45_PANMI|nr:uncharacterized protein C2845_PM18G14050 [Panicum miliaceum]
MGFLICACLLQLLLSATASVVAAQSQPLSPARILDATLQDYAYRAFVRPRTGIVYNATLPANLTGIAVSAVRLRSGSLRRKGFADYFEFRIPTGVVVQPHVERVVLVYHNLGSSSDNYYPLPGYTYLAPVLGLLAYDAANLSAVGLQDLNIVASGSPISVTFSNVREVLSGSAPPRCVVFDLNGMPQFRDLEATNVCSTFRQGHISIVVNSSEIAPAPAPPGAIAPPIPTPGGQKKGNSKAWKIAVSVVGAAVALGLLAALLLCLVRYKRDKKLEVMERNAEVGETIRMAQVGRTQAPVALGTRTQPLIENDYAA